VTSFTEPDSKDVKKGEKVLNSAILTDSGRDWVVRALDPMHDTPVKCNGYPDFTNISTVVQEINMSQQVTWAAGTNFDLHVWNAVDFASTGTNVAGLCASYCPQTSVVSGSSGQYVPMSGVIIQTVQSGNAFLPDYNTPSVSTTLVSTNLDPGANYISSQCRLIGIGIEVINTTAEINKQGTCTVYRQPQTLNRVNVDLQAKDSVNNTTYGATPYKAYAMPPTQLAEALILPGAKQWDASEGCYLVPTLSNVINEFAPFDNTGRIYLANNYGTNYPSGNMGALISQLLPAVSTSALSPVYYPSVFNTSGCLMTGCSPTSTFTVNVKYLVESAPGPRSPFVTLSQPSAAYDPEAIRLYSQMVNHLPSGVPSLRTLMVSGSNTFWAC